MPNNQENSPENVKERTQERKDSFARKIGEKVIQKAGKKGGKQVINPKTLNFLLKFAPIIGDILIAIIILILIVGIIAFLLTMPGLLMDKLNSIFNRAKKTIKSAYLDALDAKTSNEDIVELADYIEKMDYDLIGYGFIKPLTLDKKDKDGGKLNIKIAEELEDEGYTRVEIKHDDKDNEIYYENEKGEVYNGLFYDIDGRLYNGKNGLESISSSSIIGTSKPSSILKNGLIYDSKNSDAKITGFDENKVDYSVLKTYALSNNRLYVMRNSDTNFFSSVIKSIYKVLTGYQGTWAKGMLEVYTANDGQAIGLYDVWDKIKNLSTVEITDSNLLKLKAGFLNNPMLFDLDSWSSRYGLSSDFLISLHLATLSPDLVETICQTFDIRAQVYLDHIKGASVDAYFYTEQMKNDGVEPALYEDLKDYKNDSSLNPFDGLFLSRKEAKTIMNDFGIKSLDTGKYTCGGKDPSMVWDYSGYDSKLEGKETGKCFTEFTEMSDPWKKDVIYNQWADYKSMWTGDTSKSGSGKHGQGGTLIYLESYTFETEKDKKDQWSKKWDTFKSFLEKGDNRPGIMYGKIEETGELNYQAYWDNEITSEAKLGKIMDIFDSMENAYKRVEEGKYGTSPIVEKQKVTDLYNLKYRVFKEEDDIYIGKLMPYEDLIYMPKDKKMYYEVPFYVWPTNDDGKTDSDPFYDSEKDGEIVLSLLIRKTSVDANYDMTWVLYENYSLNKMKEKRF